MTAFQPPRRRRRRGVTAALAFASFAAFAAGVGPLAQTPSTAQPAAFACPKAQTLDCMPIVPAERRALCQKDYRDWAAKHCPGLRIVY